MKNFLRLFSAVGIDTWLFVASVALGGAMAVLVYSEGLTIGTGDQAAHLNLSRLAFDSLTPGVTQVGFMWRPLLHIVLVPFTVVDVLYRTGMAAPLLLVPCLGLSAVLFRRMLRAVGCDDFWSSVAAFSFVLQPYVLYFSVVPMTEMLFVTLLLLTLWSFLRWYQHDELRYAFLCAVFLSLAFLARVEGIVLLPIVVAFMLARLAYTRASLSQSAALLLLFSMLASIGVALTMLYGFVYSIGVLSFLTPSQLITVVQANDATKVRNGFADVLSVVTIIRHAFWYIVGKPFFAVAFAFVPFAFLGRSWKSRLPLLILLASPVVFIGFAIFQNKASIVVPELPRFRAPPGSSPAGYLIDVRYVLTGIGLLFAAPCLVASTVVGALRRRGLKKVAVGFSALFLIALLSTSIPHSALLMSQDFSWVRNDKAFSGIPGAGVYLPGEYLREHYDFGFILASHQNNDRTFITAEIPLDKYVQEANYRYFEQATREPWLFARWVLVSVDGGGKMNPFILRAENLPDFSHYYSLVYQTDRTRVYKLNETVLRNSAKALGVPWTLLPSLNRELTTWDPSTIYRELASTEGE